MLPFYSGDYGDGNIRIVEDALNQSPVNLNHPFSALHFIASDPKDDKSLENSFWYGEAIKNPDDGWRFPKCVITIIYHLTRSIVKSKLEEGLRQTYSQWQSQIHHFQKTFSLPFPHLE